MEVQTHIPSQSLEPVEVMLEQARRDVSELAVEVGVEIFDLEGVVGEEAGIPRGLVKLEDVGLEKIVVEPESEKSKQPTVHYNDRKILMSTCKTSVRQIVADAFTTLNDTLLHFATTLADNRVPLPVLNTYTSLTESITSLTRETLLQIPEVSYKTPHTFDRSSDPARRTAYLEQCLVEAEKTLQTMTGQIILANQISQNRSAAEQLNKSHLMRELLKLRFESQQQGVKCPVFFRNSQVFENDEEKLLHKFQTEQIEQVIDYCNSRWSDQVDLLNKRHDLRVADLKSSIRHHLETSETWRKNYVKRVEGVFEGVASGFTAKTAEFEVKLRTIETASAVVHPTPPPRALLPLPRPTATRCTQTTKDLFHLPPTENFIAECFQSMKRASSTHGNMGKLLQTTEKVYTELSKPDMSLKSVKRLLSQAAGCIPEGEKPADGGIPTSTEEVMLEFVPSAVPIVVSLRDKRTAAQQPPPSGIPKCEACRRRKIIRRTAPPASYDPKQPQTTLYSKRLHKYTSSLVGLSCSQGAYTVSVPLGRDPPETVNTIGCMTCA